MANELVKALRDRVSQTEKRGLAYSDGMNGLLRLMSHAADEIERLHNQVKGIVAPNKDDPP